MSQVFMKSLLPAVFSGLVLVLAGCGGSDQPVFEDVTYSSGLDYQGMTHGAAWGDFDGDGYPDLYLNNHLNEAGLYRNKGDGRFEDASALFAGAGDRGGDAHGASWADFDNDGDQDLVQLTGAMVGVGAEPKKLFLNESGVFRDVGEALGVGNPLGRTRTPLWFDADRDGRLDLFMGAEARFDDETPPFWFLQTESGFRPDTEIGGDIFRSTPFCLISELDGDRIPDLICRVHAPRHAYQIKSSASRPFEALDLLPNTAFSDIAAGDFDGDLDFDLYLARNATAGQVVWAQPRANELQVDLKADRKTGTDSFGFSFRSRGEVEFLVSKAHSYKPFSHKQILIGGQGRHPAGFSFTLSPEGVVGLAPDEAVEESRLRVGFKAPDQWTVFLQSVPSQSGKGARKLKYDHLAIQINSTAVVDNVEALGVETRSTAAQDRLFINHSGSFQEEGDNRGIGHPLPSASVVAADFDNDMDLDLYVVSADQIGNPANVLLMNKGDGHFEKVGNAGGALGSRLGIGETVVSADFDRDGFVDLLLANGASMGPSLGPASDQGGYQLYRNRGNGNHWLEIDLEGTASNRDGIGAIVYLTAGGITQVRMQDGGMHHLSQNDMTLHFGLGKHQAVDEIEIHWPSGTVQRVSAVAADQLLLIREEAP